MIALNTDLPDANIQVGCLLHGASPSLQPGLEETCVTSGETKLSICTGQTLKNRGYYNPLYPLKLLYVINQTDNRCRSATINFRLQTLNPIFLTEFVARFTYINFLRTFITRLHILHKEPPVNRFFYEVTSFGFL